MLEACIRQHACCLKGYSMHAAVMDMRAGCRMKTNTWSLDYKYKMKLYITVRKGFGKSKQLCLWLFCTTVGAPSTGTVSNMLHLTIATTNNIQVIMLNACYEHDVCTLTLTTWVMQVSCKAYNMHNISSRATMGKLSIWISILASQTAVMLSSMINIRALQRPALNVYRKTYYSLTMHKSHLMV